MQTGYSAIYHLRLGHRLRRWSNLKPSASNHSDLFWRHYIVYADRTHNEHDESVLTTQVVSYGVLYLRFVCFPNGVNTR